jgi:hypothetical protein
MGKGFFLFPAGGEVRKGAGQDGAAGARRGKCQENGNGFGSILFPVLRSVPVALLEQDLGRSEVFPGMPGGVGIRGESRAAVESRQGSGAEKEEGGKKKKTCMEKPFRIHPATTQSRKVGWVALIRPRTGEFYPVGFCPEIPGRG